MQIFFHAFRCLVQSSFISQPVNVNRSGRFHAWRHQSRLSDTLSNTLIKPVTSNILKALLDFFFCMWMCFNANLHRNLHIPVVLKVMPGAIAAMRMTDRCYSIHPLTQPFITMFLLRDSNMHLLWTECECLCLEVLIDI